MISKIVLIITFLLIALIAIIISRAIINKQKIIGKPPVPVFYFILAKMLVVINMIFLLLKGLNINVCSIFSPIVYIDAIALVFLIIGSVILFLSTIKLNKDLVFGLSSSENHKLQTRGIYSISRHPFYLGFIFILFSSCLFNPNLLNIIAFSGAWIIHHFIMIKEEEFLLSEYGEAYNQYTKRVKRYLTF
ncbi:MAG: isoprenylcysteine carboxylmethyltransferase family protein [Bacteroidetes bacterium]|nr:isoprenylcysteine carboxylmethyltransferase family protein [Bacteroidota bacterium]